MTPSEYQRDVKRTMNPDVVGKMLLLNAALGLGESGEAQSEVKKYVFQGHELQADKIMNELGDQLYYICLMADWLGYSLQDVMDMNVEKREKRYPSGFEAERSINR